MCKGITTWRLTHNGGPNGDGRYDNPDTMGPVVSVSPRLTHPHAFSVDRTSRMQNFNWIPIPNIPNIKNPSVLTSGTDPMGTAEVTKRLFWSKESSSFDLFNFFF